MIQTVPLLNKSSVCVENSNFSKLKLIPNKIPIARLLRKIALKELFSEINKDIWELANYLSYKIDFRNIYYLNQSLIIFKKHIK